MTAKDAQNHMEDIRNQLSILLFHEQTLKREIELLKQKFESSIVKPKTLTNLSAISKNDLEIDVIPCNLAPAEVIEARKAFYYATNELAQVQAEIIAKKNLFNTYKEHIQQELQKQAKPLTDEMIFDLFRQAQSLKDKTPEETAAIKDISENLPKILNSGKDARITLYETLQNIISQHGI